MRFLLFCLTAIEATENKTVFRDSVFCQCPALQQYPTTAGQASLQIQRSQPSLVGSLNG